MYPKLRTRASHAKFVEVPIDETIMPKEREEKEGEKKRKKRKKKKRREGCEGQNEFIQMKQQTTVEVNGLKKIK